MSHWEPFFCVGNLLPQSHVFGANISDKKSTGFKYCLNTSTIREHKLGLIANLEIASKAGYDGVELCLKDIYQYLEKGGSISELKNELLNLNLTFENAIAFHEWIVDDENIRRTAIRNFEKDLELISELGCNRIGAPPSGATTTKKLDLNLVTDRYKKLLQSAEKFEIMPMLEIWGASLNLSKLSEAMFVILESKHKNACILSDIYHLHRGGSGFAGLELISSSAIPVFHVNDYPGDIPLHQLKDANRVFPGDGIAPMASIVENIKRINSEMVLSLELFNPDYWKKDALEVASEGLIKMKKVFN